MDEPFRKWLINIDPLETDTGAVEQEWLEILKRILFNSVRRWSNNMVKSHNRSLGGRIKGKPKGKEPLYSPRCFGKIPP